MADASIKVENIDIGNGDFFEDLSGDMSFTPIEKTLLNTLKNGVLTRDQLVKKLDTPRTTLFDGLRKLMYKGLVTKYPVYMTERERGRPPVLFSLTDIVLKQIN